MQKICLDAINTVDLDFRQAAFKLPTRVDMNLKLV